MADRELARGSAPHPDDGPSWWRPSPPGAIPAALYGAGGYAIGQGDWKAAALAIGLALVASIVGVFVDA